jgi:small subunit ribosomal protein S5
MDYNNQGQHNKRSIRRGFGPRGRGASKPEFEQKVLDIARVTRVTKGGKRFSFRTTVVAGDQKSKVGMGTAKGTSVPQSIQKAYNKAKKSMIVVPIVNGTIPYQIKVKYNSAVVLLKPSSGGVKAGGPVRVVAQLCGITALTGKLLSRSNNKINIAKAAIKALSQLRVKKLSGSKSITL